LGFEVPVLFLRDWRWYGLAARIGESHMTASTPFDLDKLFEGSLRRLRAEAEYFSRLTDHNAELGRLNETHLVKLLRDYLPPKVGIGSGFIVCGGATPVQSPQCDIVLSTTP
jgi:hypothetical protein